MADTKQWAYNKAMRTLLPMSANDAVQARIEEAEAEIARLREQVATIRRETLEEAAKLIEANQEVVGLKSAKRYLEPRSDGNLVALAYAEALRALSNPGRAK